MIETLKILTDMVYTIGIVWHLLIMLNSILTQEIL